MILAKKYMNLANCALRVALLLLEELAETRTLELAEAEDRIVERLGEAGRINLMPAILFLYLVKAINYEETSGLLVLENSRTAA